MQLLIPQNLEAPQDTAAAQPLLEQTSNDERRAHDLQIRGYQTKKKADALKAREPGCSFNKQRFKRTPPHGLRAHGRTRAQLKP
jgi:hypothetical protein